MPVDTGVTVADVRAWAGVSPGSVTDAQLQQVLDAEVDLQQKRCRDLTADVPYPAALVQSLYRRCARELSARNVPLGVLNDVAEFGPTKLPQYDAEINRLEGPYRLWGLA